VRSSGTSPARLSDEAKPAATSRISAALRFAKETRIRSSRKTTRARAGRTPRQGLRCRGRAGQPQLEATCDHQVRRQPLEHARSPTSASSSAWPAARGQPEDAAVALGDHEYPGWAARPPARALRNSTAREDAATGSSPPPEQKQLRRARCQTEDAEIAEVDRRHSEAGAGRDARPVLGCAPKVPPHPVGSRHGCVRKRTQRPGHPALRGGSMRANSRRSVPSFLSILRCRRQHPQTGGATPPYGG
jgi:hypothetical protein